MGKEIGNAHTSTKVSGNRSPAKTSKHLASANPKEHKPRNQTTFLPSQAKQGGARVPNMP